MENEVIAPEEAQYVLGSYLTQDEKEELVALRHQLSQSIDWRDLAATMQAELLSFLDGVISEGNCSKEIPFKTLSGHEQEFLYGEHENGDIRKRFVMLLLLKKLLGGLKQNVRQDLDDLIQGALDYEEESQLHTLAQGDEVLELTAVITPQTEGACSHSRKLVRKLPADGKKRKFDVLQTECRECGIGLGNPRICQSPAKSTPYRQGNCQHSEAEWIEGQEGREATCFECGENAPDIHKYKWGAVGLEPAGDNPDDDVLEVIIPHA